MHDDLHLRILRMFERTFLHLHILRMFEGTFLLYAAHFIFKLQVTAIDHSFMAPDKEDFGIIYS